MNKLVSLNCGAMVLTGCLLAGLSGCESQTSPKQSRLASDSKTRGSGTGDNAATDKASQRDNGNSTNIKAGDGVKVSSTGDKSVAVVDGVAYEVRGTKGNGSVFIIGGRVEITKGANKLQFRDGKLIANGRDAGTVNTGDEVLLDENGKLFVNKQER